ncbi:MAG: hypothetical protein MJB57_11985, partial [Gemmatimonadetes bacterium]|nr:hypothetical protein [Gemmatimonadota bacterium]
MIVEGDGSIAFFEETATAGQYTRPAGDFSELVYLGNKFERRYPDGSIMRWSRPSAHGQEVVILDVKDRFDNRTSYSVDAGNDNRLSIIMGPTGYWNQMQFWYPTSTSIEIRSPPTSSPRVVTLTLDGAGNLDEISGPGPGSQLDASYDSDHLMTFRIDRAGERWDYAYDGFGRLSFDQMPTIVAGGSSTRPKVSFTSLEHVILPPLGEGTSSNHATPILRDSVFVDVTDPENNATLFQPSRLGPPIEIREPLGRTTVFALDGDARPTKITLPSGGIVVNKWTEEEAKLEFTTDSTTLQTVNYTYVTMHPSWSWMVRPETISGDDIPTQTFSWSSATRSATLESVSLAGAVTQYEFDSRGRITKITDPAGYKTTYAYLSNGLQNRDSVVVVGVTSAGDRVTKFTYDQFGRDSIVTNPLSETTTFEYDDLNRVTKVTNAQGNETATDWGDLYQDKITDAIGQVYDFTTNAVGWVTQRTDPRGKSDIYAYDKNGNVTSWTDRNGTVTTYEYDDLNNLESVNSGGHITTYVTDPDGRFAVVDNGVSRDSVFFDQAGRTQNHVTIRGGQTFQQDFTWDKAGRRTNVAWSGEGTSIGYAFNATGQLETLTDVDGGTTTMGYNANLQADEIDIAAVPGNQNVLYQYPSTHRTAKVQFGHTTLNDAFELKMRQDELGRTIDRHRVGVDTTRFFNYDDVGRLERYEDWEFDSSSCPFNPDKGNMCIDGNMVFSDAVDYTYDDVGNRLDHGATVSNGNRLDAFDGYTLTWDDAGFLLSKTKTGFTQNFYWNARGQLDSVSTTVGSTTTKSRYRYDGMGRRIETDIDGEMRRYWHDGD